MNDKSLTYVLALQEEGQISLAAQKLGITPSSLSIFLQRLEKNIGVTLYDRKRRKTTAAGDLYCQGAKKILQIHAAALQEIASLSSPSPLNIGIDICINEGAPDKINQILSRFSRQYPDLPVKIFFLQEQQLRDYIAQEKLDFAYYYLNAGELFRKSEFSNVTAEELMYVVSKDSAPYPDFASAITHLNYIGMFKGSEIHTLCSELFFTQSLTPKTAIETDTYTLAQELIRTGAYLTIIPASARHRFPDFRILPIKPPVCVSKGIYLSPSRCVFPPFQYLMSSFQTTSDT